MFENVRADIQMYLAPSGHIGPIKRMGYLLATHELHAVLIYRFGRWAKYRCRTPVVGLLLRGVYLFLRKWSEVVLGIGIWPESEIGPGLKVEHSGSVYIYAHMGKQCRVSQQVVIGHVGGFRGGGVPVIGDGVYVGAGAKILGDVKIGNGAKIGANAVVLTDVPEGAVAVGVPARVKVSQRGSGAAEPERDVAKIPESH